ncbi:hypothetical protein Tco_0986192 [Tanacetum coccineum]
MTTLAEHIIVVGAENRPPMLDKSMYNLWQSRMWLYIKGNKNGRMMLKSIENVPLVYSTIEENGQIRKKKYAELTDQEKLQDGCDVQATNIAAKDIWDRVKLLVQGTELSYHERECKLYNEFDKFTSVKEWSKFVTDVELAKNMYNTNYDQLYAYLSQHEVHANEARMLHERYPDPLALKPQAEFPQIDSGLVFPSFLPSDDPIACLNKAMALMSTVMASRLLFNKFKGDRVRVLMGEGHMARQYTQPKRLRNFAWFKEKMLLVQAQESGQVLDEEQLAFLVDPGIADGQAS